jgi:hypothetical protein
VGAIEIAAGVAAAAAAAGDSSFGDAALRLRNAARRAGQNIPRFTRPAGAEEHALVIAFNNGDFEPYLQLVTNEINNAEQRSYDIKYRFMQLVAGFAGKNITDVAYLQGYAGIVELGAKKNAFHVEGPMRRFADARLLADAQELARRHALAVRAVGNGVARPPPLAPPGRDVEAIRGMLDRNEPPVNGEVVRELARRLEVVRDKEFTTQYDATMDNVDWTAPFAAAVEMALAKLRGRVDKNVSFTGLTECKESQTTKGIKEIKNVWADAVKVFKAIPTHDERMRRAPWLLSAGQNFQKSLTPSPWNRVYASRYEKKLCNTSLTTMFAYLISRQYILGLNLNARDYRKLIDYRRLIVQENAVVLQIRRLWCGRRGGGKRCKREGPAPGRSVIDDFFMGC